MSAPTPIAEVLVDLLDVAVWCPWLSDWERGFLADLESRWQASRSTWTPTQAQADKLRGLAAEVADRISARAAHLERHRPATARPGPARPDTVAANPGVAARHKASIRTLLRQAEDTPDAARALDAAIRAACHDGVEVDLDALRAEAR